MDRTRDGRIRWTIAAVLGLLGLQALGPRPASAADLLLHIKEAHADMDTSQLLLRGDNLLRRANDQVLVSLSGTLLTVISQSESEILAQLPSGIEPGTYRLVVLRSGLIPGLDAIDLTLGAVGATGPEGPTGERGAMGDTGPMGIQGPAGEDGQDGEPGPAGPPGLTWRGAWTKGVTYRPQDAVEFDGSSYLALEENSDQPPLGPHSGSAWTLLAARGDVGSEGPQGPVGPQGPTGIQGLAGMDGLPGKEGATGPQGPVGPQGPTGPSGPAGELADLGCQDGQILRWVGSAWECSEEGTGLVPETLFGVQTCPLQTGGSSQTGPDCPSRVTVDVSDLGSNEPWLGVGGGRLLTEFTGAQPTGSQVEPVVLTHVAGATPFASDAFEVRGNGVSLPVVRSIKVTAFRVGLGPAKGGTGFVPRPEPVTLTLASLPPSNEYRLRQWLEDFVGGRLSPQPIDISAGGTSGQPAATWSFSGCAPLAWGLSGEGEVLTVRCSWSGYTTLGGPSILSGWLSEMFGGSMIPHDVKVVPPPPEDPSAPSPTFLYGAALFSGYVFPTFDSTVGDWATESLLIKPGLEEIR